MPGIDDLASRLRVVVRLLKRRAESLREPGGPTPSESSVLSRLDDEGAMTPRALADAHFVRPQTMQQTLDSLARRRLILRAGHPSDRRQILISLSASGRKIVARGRERRQVWLVGELRKLTGAERRDLDAGLSILERFVKNPNPKPK